MDGIDGSGKGTIVSALRKWASKKGLSVFDLREYWSSNHALPEQEDFQDFDVLVSAEPTFSLVGSAIRDELIRENKRRYSAYTTAQAYAIDRNILYKRVLIPALELDKYIFQERGVTTSITYQPVQAEPLALKKILELEGNQLALKYRPDILIIMDVKPETAIMRLVKRDKKDQAIFEKLEFQKKIDKRFKSKWFKDMFERLGSKVVYLNANGTVEQAEKKAIEIWENFLESK